jgi:biopolymer transport protein ExbD
MAMRVRDSLGMIILFGSLVMASSVLQKEYGRSGGIPVLLSHRCTQHKDLERGDGREIFVRYRSDHSSYVNDRLMPVENDLRREIAGVMATRQEQVLFFAADDRLTYGEVSVVLSDLKEDSPALVVVLLTKSQVSAVENIRRDEFRELCLSS